MSSSTPKTNATTTLTGGQAAVAALQAEGTRHVFGLIGSATMELFDGLYEASSDIRFIGVRDERTGTHMADAYARVSGEAGVILAGQNGPGATNLTTGLAQAKAAYSPRGQHRRHALDPARLPRRVPGGRPAALFTPVTKKTWTAPSTDRVPELFREAFRTALSPRRGPVQLNLPRDVLAGSTDFEPFQTPEQYRPLHLPAGADAAIRTAAAMLSRRAPAGDRHRRRDQEPRRTNLRWRWPRRWAARWRARPGTATACPSAIHWSPGRWGRAATRSPPASCAKRT